MRDPLTARGLLEEHWGPAVAEKEHRLWRQASLDSDPLTVLPSPVFLCEGLNLSEPPSPSVLNGWVHISHLDLDILTEKVARDLFALSEKSSYTIFH